MVDGLGVCLCWVGWGVSVVDGLGVCLWWMGWECVYGGWVGSVSMVDGLGVMD